MKSRRSILPAGLAARGGSYPHQLAHRARVLPGRSHLGIPAGRRSLTTTDSVIVWDGDAPITPPLAKSWGHGRRATVGCTGQRWGRGGSALGGGWGDGMVVIGLFWDMVEGAWVYRG